MKLIISKATIHCVNGDFDTDVVIAKDLRAWLDKTITKIEKWHEAPKSDRLNLMKEEHIDTTIMRYYPDGTEALYALQRELKEEASRG